MNIKAIGLGVVVALGVNVHAGALSAIDEADSVVASTDARLLSAVIPGRVGVVFESDADAARFGFERGGMVYSAELDEGARTFNAGPITFPGHLRDADGRVTAVQVARWLNEQKGVAIAEPDLREYPQNEPVEADLLVQYATSESIVNNAARGITRSGIDDSVGMGTNDPVASQQWAANQIRSESTWGQTIGNGGVVAVLDHGFHPGHADMARYDLEHSWSFTVGGRVGVAPEFVDLDHGLVVSSVIASGTDNGIGIAAVTPGATVLPFDIGDVERLAGDNTVTASTIAVAQAIDHINGAPRSDGFVLPESVRGAIAAINYSYAGRYEMTSHLILDAAERSDVVLVKAAENVPYYQFGLKRTPVDRPDQIVAPSGWEESVMVVGGTASDGIHYTMSPKGSLIDLYAPAERLPLLDSQELEGWRSTSGNSFAAPHVAGVLAAMKSVWPSMSREDVFKTLRSTGMTVDVGAPGRDELYAYGILDHARAIQTALREGQGFDWVIPEYEDEAYGQILLTSDGFYPGLAEEIEDSGLLSSERPAERAVLDAIRSVEGLYYAEDNHGGEVDGVVIEAGVAGATAAGNIQ